LPPSGRKRNLQGVKLSVLDLYTIGIGPSSSHTVGPMRAARRFADAAVALSPARVRVELFGSLALTGRGHGTHLAVAAGLAGERPESVEPASLPQIHASAGQQKQIRLAGECLVRFDPASDIHFNRRRSLPFHPNGMRFTALSRNDEMLLEETFYSLGGGFILREGEPAEPGAAAAPLYPFSNAAELMAHCGRAGKPVSEIVLVNESAWREEEETIARLDRVWRAMQECVSRGLSASGLLPGGLRIARRAPQLYQKLRDRPESALRDALTILDWVDVYAIAVNEENAAGGRVVTAPTNGAAGIIPAVMHYCDRFLNSRDPAWHRPFLLTAGAIGVLFKENASISGADVGCQGEVGVACSMAAGALAEFMGGTPGQVENAAEIGMEHNLGLTCDPVGGLVQIPCIERNAMGAVKAINAARIALRGDGRHAVSLDAVIRTMRDTGRDMRRKYKETSRGGLAVNVVEC
jgi:L-serine dehydratase